MLEIIKQETVTKEGNDCLIQDCFTVLKCHEVYIVMDIHKCTGWCDNTVDIRGRKEFSNELDAVGYYDGELRNVCL